MLRTAAAMVSGYVLAAVAVAFLLMGALGNPDTASCRQGFVSCTAGTLQSFAELTLIVVALTAPFTLPFMALST